MLSQAEFRDIISNFSPEETLSMQTQAYFCSIIAGIYNTGSTNHETIVRNMFNDFNQDIPYDLIDYVVATMLPDILSMPGLLIDDKLSPDAEVMAIMHNKIFLGKVEVLH